MTLEKVVTVIKSLFSDDTQVTAGRIDSSLTKTIGVHGDKSAPSKRQIAIGGEEATDIHCDYFTCVVHWSDNATETEEKAKELFRKLSQANFPQVSYADISEPVFVGEDEKGIFEYTINFKLYERKE